MYKILVTTFKHAVGVGGSHAVAVHSLVIEFNNAQDAKNAVQRIAEENKHGPYVSDYNQKAILLF